MGLEGGGVSSWQFIFFKYPLWWGLGNITIRLTTTALSWLPGIRYQVHIFLTKHTWQLMWSVLLWTLYFDYKYKTNWQEENRNYRQQHESIKKLGRNVHTKMISQNRSLQTQRTPSLKMSHWTCHLHIWSAKANSSARPTRLPLLAIQRQRKSGQV